MLIVPLSTALITLLSTLFAGVTDDEWLHYLLHRGASHFSRQKRAGESFGAAKSYRYSISTVDIYGGIENERLSLPFSRQ